MTNQSKKPRNLTKKHVARLERDRQQVMIVRTIAIAMFVLIALLLGYGYLDTTYLQKLKPIAEVNGEKITLGEWQERIQFQRINLTNTLQRYQFFQDNFGLDYSQQIQQVNSYLQFPEILGTQVLDQMVDEVLIKQEAEKRGITVTDDEVEKYIQEQGFNFFPDGTPTPTITPTALEYPTLSSQQLTLYPHTATPTTAPTSTPASTSTPDPSASPTATEGPSRPTPTFVPEDATPTVTPYTLDGFKSEYQTMMDNFKQYGVSEKVFRSAYRNTLLHDKLLEAVTADQPTTEEQVWARHILVDNESLAGTVSLILSQGGDFAEAAGTYSIDTGSAANGGDLGWFGKGQMVPEFEAAAFSQPIGEIGKPVQSQFGYHIIQVLDRRELPLSASQLQQNRDAAFTEWLTTIRDSATIVKNDNWQSQIPPTPVFAAQ